jgi:transcriptional regulator with XRE-family HTH domain
MSEHLKRIGQKIREFRTYNGWSQRELAEFLKVSKPYVSSLESGKRNPSVKSLIKILNVLKMDIFDFFSGNSKTEIIYSDYHDYFIKNLLKNCGKWYLPGSGLWNERYIEEMRSVLTKKRTLREYKIITRYLKNKRISILDAPCGHGRITNLLAANGYKATGIDVNEYFINLAKKEAEKSAMKANYLIGDIFSYVPKREFDAVINIFTSLGYFESEEKNEFFIKKICGFVKNGGFLIIETVNPFGVLKNYRSRETSVAKNGTRIVQERFFDPKTSTNIEQITDYYLNGEIFKGLHCVRLYYPHELIKICHRHGLKIMDILDQEGKNKRLLDDFRFWMIFKKID